MSKLTPAQEDAADRAERLMSMSKAAALLGRDRNTLAAWAAKGMPIARKGDTGSSNLVDLKDVVAWREEQVRREEQARFPVAGGEDMGGGGVRMSPADMLKLEQLKLTRLKVGQTAEILIPRALAEAAFQRCLGLVRQAVMAVPERIARDMSGFPEDRVLKWRSKAKDHCAAALTEGAKAIRDVMPDFEVPPAS